MADEKRLLKAVVKCQSDGFGFDLTAEVSVDEIPKLIGKLRAVGVEPTNSPHVRSDLTNVSNAQQTAAPRMQPVTGNH